MPLKVISPISKNATITIRHGKYHTNYKKLCRRAQLERAELLRASHPT